MIASETHRYALIAILVSSAAALQIIESPLPRFLPWLKPGLANVLTLYAIIRISAGAGLVVAAFRTFVAATFLGTLLSPVHLISFAGAMSATLVMVGANYLCKNAGLATISICGAMASNFAQLMVVQIMFAGTISFWFHIAIMIWVAIPSGLIVAKLTQELLRRTADAKFIA